MLLDVSTVFRTALFTIVTPALSNCTADDMVTCLKVFYTSTAKKHVLLQVVNTWDVGVASIRLLKRTRAIYEGRIGFLGVIVSN